MDCPVTKTTSTNAPGTPVQIEIDQAIALVPRWGDLKGALGVRYKKANAICVTLTRIVFQRGGGGGFDKVTIVMSHMAQTGPRPRVRMT